MKKYFILIFITTSITLAQQQWHWQNPLPTGNELIDVCIVDSNTVFAVGNSGTILKTTDGGKTWKTQTFDFSIYNANAQLRKVFFITLNNGWILGSNGLVLHTMDGCHHRFNSLPYSPV
jgi:photosystem II stability/assembly factor-like uncharacterized protein